MTETGKGKMDRVPDRGRETEPLRQAELGKPRVGGRGTQWSLIVAGAFILSLVAFVSGVRMGKGLSDFKHAEAPALKAPAKGQKGFPFRSEGKGAESKASQEGRGLISQVPPPSQTKERAFEGKDSPPAEKGTSTTPEEMKTPPPPKAQFTLQVAALSNPEEARELVSQLLSKGYAAYQVTGSAAAKGTLYRVRIGQFHSLAEARQFALAFEKKEKIKTIIVSLP